MQLEVAALSSAHPVYALAARRHTLKGAL
jgi:hypothetical protein